MINLKNIYYTLKLMFCGKACLYATSSYNYNFVTVKLSIKTRLFKNSLIFLPAHTSLHPHSDSNSRRSRTAFSGTMYTACWIMVSIDWQRS